MFKLSYLQQQSSSPKSRLVHNSQPSGVIFGTTDNSRVLETEADRDAKHADDQKTEQRCCECGFSSTWMLGLLCVVFGSILDLVSFAFASISLLGIL